MKKNLKLFLLTILGTWMAGSAWAEEHYLVGGCTDSGWNTGENTRSTVAMMQVSDNVWVWCGKLTIGKDDDGRFKIPEGADSWGNGNNGGYWAPAQGTVLTSDWSSLSTSGDGDYKYCVAEEGYYKVTINTNTKQIKAEKLTEPTTKDGDYYLINSVADYYWFASAVISGEQSLKARLNADLDFSTDGFFPLGNDKDVNGNRTHNFKGEFDGQGHAMTGVVIKGSYSKLAPFRSIDGATIKNLKVVGEINTSKQFMGGLVSQSRGSSIIENVVVDMAMTSSHSGDGTHGGVISVAWGTPTMKNIAVVGSIYAPNNDGTCGMIGYAHSGNSIYYTNCFVDATITLTGTNNRVFGRNGEHCTNCYTTNTTMTKLNDASNFDGGEVIADQVASGELAYKLNGNSSDNVAWYQAIGTDAYPVPFGTAVVYAVGDLYCDGTSKGGDLTFSNTNESNRDEHHFNEWGFCDKVNNGNLCNDLQLDYMTPNGDGYYEIGTKAQLNWFAVRVNGHKTTIGERGINGKLTADIDFSDQTNMIGGDGNGAAYQGTFDGQGHKVTLAYAANAHNAALFRTISAAHILNLVTDGTISNEGGNCAGGIFGGSYGASLVENCVSYVALNRNNGGDATFGGIGAYMHDNGKIKNCAFYGSINTPNASGNGGLLGYANGGGNIAIENCIVNASAFTFNESITDGGRPVSIARNTGNVKHTYVVNAGNATQDEAKIATDAQVASGELAFFINSESESGMAWYQKLGDGADPAPLPFFDANKVVYANGSFYCDGMPESITYENVERTATTAPHNYGTEWGLCTNSHGGIVCDDANPNFVAQESGYYPLKDEKELNWFALFVNQGKGDNANAKLTADIDMTLVPNFPGIGTNDHRYRGIFDGQKHRISNLNMNYPSDDGVGFFRYVTSGGTVIKRFTIDSSCEFKGNTGVGAFVGRAQGRNDDRSLTFEELGNEANVTANGANGGGILGVDMLSDAIITIKNCYNTGAITSGNEGGAFSGWLGDKTKVINCYNIGAVTNGEGLARANGDKEAALNLFANVNTSGLTISGEQKADEDFSNGTVFTALFDYTNDTYSVNGNVWRMEFDVNGNPTHPVLYEPATVVLKEDFPNRIVAKENANVDIYRTFATGDEDWNTFVVPFNISNDDLKAAFGNDVQVAEYSENSSDAHDVTVSFQTMGTPAVTANVPVLLKTKATAGVYSFTGNVEAATPVKTGTNFDFVGTYDAEMTVADGDYFLNGKKIYKSQGATTLSGTRAFFKAKTAGARIVGLSIDDNETTSINNVNVRFNDNNVYNLKGQRVDKPTSGIYIQNGKKVVK